jgi:hypothetical protein
MTAFLSALGIEIVIGIAEIYIPMYSVFAVFRFLLGASAGAAYTCAYVCGMYFTKKLMIDRLICPTLSVNHHKKTRINFCVFLHF